MVRSRHGSLRNGCPVQETFWNNLREIAVLLAEDRPAETNVTFLTAANIALSDQIKVQVLLRKHHTAANGRVRASSFT
jgi:hypothetical protein